MKSTAWSIPKEFPLSFHAASDICGVNVYREEEQVQKPHLVVVPLSTFPNWEREFALWAPQLNVVPFIGNQAGRTVIKTHELYADPSQVKGKTKALSRHAELQVSIHSTGPAAMFSSQGFIEVKLHQQLVVLLRGSLLDRPLLPVYLIEAVTVLLLATHNSHVQQSEMLGQH